MDINEILRTINLPEKYYRYFNNAFLMLPQYSKTKNQIIFNIKTQNVLPFEVYRQLKECLKEYFHADTDLIIDTFECTIDTGELNNYFLDFARENRISSEIPLVSDRKININLPDDQLSKLRDYLVARGITYQVVNEEIKINEPQRQGRDYYARNAADTRSRTRSLSPDNVNREKYKLMPVDALKEGMKDICAIGKVFRVDYQTFRNGREMQKIYITDYRDARIIKRFEDRNTTKAMLHEIEEDQIIKVYGSVKHDDYERDTIITADFIEKMDVDPWKRVDSYPGMKHIDLHVHTNRTEMDGVADTKKIISQAFKFGQKAIAITDIGVVQAYPLAQQIHMDLDKKNPGNDFKVIYGIEMKVADEKLPIVFNPDDSSVFNAEYVVLDLETTGLSTKYDYIIEFGGIIVRNNTIVESSRKQIFVKPPVLLPPFIEQKTNITNAMLEEASPLEEVIDEILDFIGDRVIVAHNADFDFKFLNQKLIEMGREPLKNVCLDTLSLAKVVVKNRKYYRLGQIAKNYSVKYDDEAAHRGDYDAYVLAQILVRMILDIPDYREVTFRQLQEKQGSDIYKKAFTHNVVLLARNMAGIKSIYELVSLSHTKYLTYFAKENAKKADSDVVAEPRIVMSEILKRRKNLIIGSGNLYGELIEDALNRSDEEVEECMKMFDYVELQPLECYSPLLEEGSSADEERLLKVVNTIIRIADKLGKPVIASNDVYYINPEEKIAREIYIMAKRIGGGRHPLCPLRSDKQKKFTAPNQHLMTTNEMLDAFSFVRNRAVEFVIENPARIADMIDKIYPIPTKLMTPTIEGCEQLLTDEIYKNAHEIYGDPLPEIVADRIEKELNSVVTNGFSVQYYIAYLLVKKSNEDGYIVGSRGSVGSSFIATMANITEVNPLVPHYVCPKCKHSEFFTNNEYANGFDLPEKRCPICGEPMNRNGHSIPFETFLGFHGDKVPDIDLNFSEENQNKSQLLIRDIFGEDYTYRAGTIGTVAQKTAFGYVKGYCEDKGLLNAEGKPVFSNAYQELLSQMCTDVKRTTGQHPGGIVVIPKEKEVHDFTPIQYPANDPFADWKTTHFAFSDLHDNILKLDILGHVDPTAVRLLQIMTGVDPKSIPMNDPKALSLFSSIDAMGINDPDGIYQEKNGAAGLPEFGTRNNRNILDKTKPTTFAELVSLSGLTHGTDVWANNAERWIDELGLTLKDVIACRDDIMTYLISKGLDSKKSFDIMENVRKGRGLNEQWIRDMREHDVPEWYIKSCLLIKYMFPKAHAVAYVMMAVRIAWWKVYYPAEYYACYFSCRCDAYEIETLLKGKEAIYKRLMEIRRKLDTAKNTVSTKEKALESTLEIALEMYLRGYSFSNISLRNSEAMNFRVDPDNPKQILPSFNCIDGLGRNVANSIVEAREDHFFQSKEDFQKRTLVNNTQRTVMEKLGILKELSDENQLSLF